MNARKDNNIPRSVVASALAEAIDETERRMRIKEISSANGFHRLEAIRALADALGIKPSEIGR